MVNLGYSLQSIWDNIEDFEIEIESSILSQKMRNVFYYILSRAQKTQDLERLAILVSSLPDLIYCPNFPEEEDFFAPVDDLVWGFVQRISEQKEVKESIKDAAITALMRETQGIDIDDLMAEPVYVWAIDNK